MFIGTENKLVAVRGKGGWNVWSASKNKIIWDVMYRMLNESKVKSSYLTLCDPMDYSLPCSSVYGTLQGRIMEWVAISFSRVPYWPGDRTWISPIAGRFFTVWKWKSPSTVWLFAIPWTNQSMEFFKPEYFSGKPFPSPGDLPNPGIEPKSPTLQAESLPVEPPGKPLYCLGH